MEAVIHLTQTWLGPPPPFGAPPCQDQCKGWSLSSTCSRTPTWRRIWRRVQERGISSSTCNVSIMRYFRVTFHNASTHPLVDEFGHNVQPYTSTNFAINKVLIILKVHYTYKSCSQVKYTRQEAPYDTDCYKDWSRTNYSDIFLNSTNWPYTFTVSIH